MAREYSYTARHWLNMWYALKVLHFIAFCFTSLSKKPLFSDFIVKSLSPDIIRHISNWSVMCEGHIVIDISFFVYLRAGLHKFWPIQWKKSMFQVRDCLYVKSEGNTEKHYTFTFSRYWVCTVHSVSEWTVTTTNVVVFLSPRVCCTALNTGGTRDTFLQRALSLIGRFFS